MTALAILALSESRLLLGFEQRPEEQTPTIRTEVNLVSVYFTVRDKKRHLVTQLPKEEFQVFEDHREQPIRFFAHHTDVPLTLGVLLDTSTSLPRTLGLEAEASSHFLRTVMRPKDLAFAFSYNARVEVLQVPTEEVVLLERKIQTIRRYARTEDLAAPPPGFVRWPFPSAIPVPIPVPGPRPDPDLRVARLYDAVTQSVYRFLDQEAGRKAMVIVALADDAKSKATLEDALYMLKQNDVITYILQVRHEQRRNVIDNCDLLHIFLTSGPNRLARLAEETGGRVIEVSGFDRIQGALNQIAEELHNQYSLGYLPTNQNWDGKFRRIEIKARARRYKVQARDGYYATTRSRP